MRTDCGTTSAAPAANAVQMSETEVSKLSEANCRTRLPAPMPNRPAWWLTSTAGPACGTTTPLGRPVEPEV